MTYQRKTHDEWDIQQCFDGQWETVNTELTWEDKRRSVREYRDNQPEYPVRSVKRRVRNEEET